jgi:hypothetical protein
MATLGGYIITIVGLNNNNQIQYAVNSLSAVPSLSTASKVYHLTINKDTKINNGRSVEVAELENELNKNNTSAILAELLVNNKFEVKYATKDGDKIQVSDSKPSTTIGGKKRSQHKYSRKR